MLSPCTERPAAAHTSDARGLPCPLPLLRLARDLRQLRPGQVVELLADDPGARDDVLTWTSKSGHTLVCWEAVADHDVYYVRKRPG